MSPKPETWQALAHIWLQADPHQWEAVKRIIAEARGAVLIQQALQPSHDGPRLFIVYEIADPRLIGDEL